MQYAESQQNEIEALHAIYMDDFAELPTAAVWKNTQPPPKVCVHLRPSSEFEGKTGIAIDVVVAMTPTYPATLPLVTLENANALHPKQLETIRRCVDNTLKELRGSEVVFEVTSNIQNLLDEYARIATEAPSLEQDRLQRIKDAELRDQRRREREEQEKQERISREEQKFESLVLEELEDQRQQQAEAEAEAEASDHDKMSTGNGTRVSFEKSVTARKDSGALVVFRSVEGSVQIPSDLFLGVSTLVKPLLRRTVAPSTDNGNADLILRLTRVDFKGKWWSSQAAARLLRDVGYELDVVREFRHPGVVPLLASKLDRTATGEWTAFFLTPYPGLPTLSEVLDAVEAVAVRVARSWAIQLLEALEALHKAGIRHKCIDLSSVVLHHRKDTGETSVLLNHPSYLHTLVELNKQHPIGGSPNSSELSHAKWPPPEFATGKLPSSKSDMWQFGVLIVQLLAGPQAVLAAPHKDPLAFVKSAGWPATIESFLASVFQPEPARRPSALDLLTASFLRTEDETEPAKTAPRSSAVLVASPATGFSRYKNDFDESAVLGRGGFGQVVKARNKLDGRVYAIKKIQATPQTLSHILQEVVLLSRLNHQYVVRYYTVWLEDAGGTRSQPPLSGPNELSSTTLSSQVSSQALSRASSVTPSRTPSRYQTPLGHRSSMQMASLSFSDLDMSLSQNLPTASDDFIQFGYSDSSQSTSRVASQDPEEQDQDDTVSMTPVPKQEIQQHTTLYIQMEYCENHTLGDLIHQGLYHDPAEYWRLLRQMLEALAYIHADGVIHRDLKPKNIFIDNARNIKIGDFGLARSVVQSEITAPNRTGVSSGAAGTSQKSPNHPHPRTQVNAEADDLTTEVGTSLYAAVELFHARGNYNEKVDMFSLGIIFFEMCFPMDTEMERVKTIRALRLPDIEMPAKFASSKKYASESEIVRSLLNHDPVKRPSASDLLTSSRIPAGGRDLTIKEALHSLVNTDAVNQLTEALFSRPVEPAQQVLYDRQMTTETASQHPGVSDELRWSDVEARLRHVFRTHGAVENVRARPRVFPRSPFYPPGSVCELLDRHGTVLQLPCDLVLPYARRLAEVVPDYTKCFALGPVFAPSLGSGAVGDQHQQGGLVRHPLVRTEAKFDVISVDSGNDFVYEDAEAVAAISAVNQAFGHLGVVVLNHTELLEAVLDKCGFTPGQHTSALSLVGVTGVHCSSNAQRRREILATSMCSAESLDSLRHFAFREPLNRVESRLDGLLGFRHPALNHLRAVSELAERFGAPASSIVVAPLAHVPPALTFYEGGLLMQLVHSETFSLVAWGGRYDSLVRHFRHSVLDRRTPPAHVIGFSVSLEAITSLSTSSKSLSRPRCSVLVASFSESTLYTLGIDIVRLLRSNHISADLARHVGSSEQLVASAARGNVPIVVVVKQVHNTAALGGANTAGNKGFRPLRVKHVTQKIDMDMSLDELVPFVLAELPDRGRPARPDESGAVSGSSETEKPDIVAPSEDGPSRVTILSESGRLKGGRKNRWLLEEQCRAAIARFLSSVGAAPAVTLDLRDDIIEAICSISPHAVEEWKRRVVGLSPNQKAYIMTVQSRLSTEASRSSRMILYSTKTENVFIYNTT